MDKRRQIVMGIVVFWGTLELPQIKTKCLCHTQRTERRLTVWYQVNLRRENKP